METIKAYVGVYNTNEGLYLLLPIYIEAAFLAELYEEALRAAEEVVRCSQARQAEGWSNS